MTSPRDQPAPDTVRRVKLPVPVSRAVRRLADEGGGAYWVPLILALDWAEAHPPKPPHRTGTEWVERLFKALAGSGPASPDDTDCPPAEKRKPWWKFW